MKKFAKALIGTALAVSMLIAVPACGTIPQVEEGRISAQELIESPYAIDPSKTDYESGEPGLRNPYIIGIDKDKYENEVLYPTPEGAKVFEVSAPANEFDDSTRAVQTAINQARAWKEENPNDDLVIKFPAGRFYFYQGHYDPAYDTGLTAGDYEDVIGGRYAIVLEHLDDVTFEGTVDASGTQQTEIILFGEIGFRGMKISDCDNVRLYNLQFDYGKLPYYFGEVVEIKGTDTLRIQTWEDYPVDNLDIVQYLEYDKDSNTPREDGNFLYNHNDVKGISEVTKPVAGNDHIVEIRFSQAIKNPPIGTKVALATMSSFGEVITAEHCTNIYVETVYLYAGGGSAFRCYTNENIYVNRLMCITKPGTDRLMTVTGDVLHLKNTKGVIKITNTQLENTHDDGVNISGHFYRPYGAKDTERNGVVLRWPSGMWGTFEPESGSVLAMIKTDTMRTEAYYQIDTVEVASDGNGYFVTFKKGGTAQIPGGDTVTLESDLSKIGDSSNTAFADLTRSPIIEISNCLIRNKRNRGLLLQGRNVTVSNCEFSYVIHSAIQFIAEVSSFNESTPPEHVVVKDCKFVNCDGSDIQVAAYGDGGNPASAGSIKDVTIENNLFAYQQNNSSLWFQGVSDIKLRDNWFYQPQTATSDGAVDTCIRFTNVSDVQFDGNRLDKFRPDRLSVGIYNGTVDFDTFEWGENTGFDRTELFGKSLAEEIAVSDTAVTIDGNLDDWQGISSTQIAINNATDVHIQKVDMSQVPASDFSVSAHMFVKFSESGEFAADDGLYISFEVTDDQVSFNQSAFWSGDGCEIFLSSNTASYDGFEVLKDLPDTQTLQLFMKGNEAMTAGAPCIYPGRTSQSIVDQLNLTGSNGDYDNAGAIKTAFAVTAEGYRGEVFIPFTMFTTIGENLRSGNAFALSVNFIDGTEAEGSAFGELITFSNVEHPTSTANKIPATMVAYSVAK